MPFKILIVEDDAQFRDSLCDILTLEGFSAYGVGSIAAYKAWTQFNNCDAMILDRNLPDGDGLTVLSLQKEKKHLPTIFVTCEGQLEDRVLGLNSDADYYLVKPIVTNELIAILRRFERRTNPDTGNSQKWLLDMDRWRLIWPNDMCQIPVTRSEMTILLQFINKEEHHVARDDIAKALGHDPLTYDFRRLEVMVRRLRTKARDASGQELPLITAYGKGYSFNERLGTTN